MLLSWYKFKLKQRCLHWQLVMRVYLKVMVET